MSVLQLQDVTGYKRWNDEIYGEEQHLPTKKRIKQLELQT